MRIAKCMTELPPLNAYMYLFPLKKKKDRFAFKKDNSFKKIASFFQKWIYITNIRRGISGKKIEQTFCPTSKLFLGIWNKNVTVLQSPKENINIGMSKADNYIYS